MEVCKGFGVPGINILLLIHLVDVFMEKRVKFNLLGDWVCGSSNCILAALYFYLPVKV